MNLKKFIGNRIKYYRNQRGMSQEDLADKLETTKQTVSRYEKGERQANQDILFQLSSIFNVSINEFFPKVDLVAEEPAEYVTTSRYNYVSTPISAGMPIEVDGVTSVPKISIPDSVMGKWAGNDDIYITKVNGDSMNKVMPHGSIMAVKPVELSELKNGDIVVYSCDHEYSVKRFYQYDDKVLFRPDSTDFSFTDHQYTTSEANNLRIHGKVVLYIVELD